MMESYDQHSILLLFLNCNDQGMRVIAIETKLIYTIILYLFPFLSFSVLRSGLFSYDILLYLNLLHLTCFHVFCTMYIHVSSIIILDDHV